MKSIEELIETYGQGHNTLSNNILHIIGILAVNFGLLAFLWSLPSEPIKAWLGNHPFANWASVYAVVMILYFGSQSFSLTFAGGVFYQGCLYLISRYEDLSSIDFNTGIGILIVAGFILMVVGHLMEGNVKEVRKDLSYILITPVWIFRFIYKWIGVSF